MDIQLPLDSNELARMGEFVEACAWEDHYQAAPDYIQWEQGMHIDRLGSAVVLSLTRSDDPFYSRVLGLGLVEPVEEQMLDELMEYIYDTGSKYFTVHICPQSQPEYVHDWLRWRGFWQADRHAKFIYDNPRPKPYTGDLRIEQTGADFADAFAFVTTQAFEIPDYVFPWMKACVGRPNWYHYTAWDGEDPVAAGALYVCGEVGWLGHGSTLPSHRRRGAQAAILARRLEDGLAAGCKWFISDTVEDTPENPNPSFRNMLRNGFTLAYFRWNYVFQAY